MNYSMDSINLHGKDRMHSLLYLQLYLFHRLWLKRRQKMGIFLTIKLCSYHELYSFGINKLGTRGGYLSFSLSPHTLPFALSLFLILSSLLSSLSFYIYLPFSLISCTFVPNLIINSKGEGREGGGMNSRRSRRGGINSRRSGRGGKDRNMYNNYVVLRRVHTHTRCCCCCNSSGLQPVLPVA
uniref:Transmembrane protein n=1 Tax=Cacopsylla melanoneura TaxID=428564 RepID=A0A8D9B374_9HEMI